MDFNKLTTRFRQFGGMRLVLQYAKLGVLPAVVRGFVRCVVKRQSFKAIYPEVLKRVEPFLAERFHVSRFKIQTNELPHKHPKVIWWCWLQGIENAPDIVLACYNSLVHGEWFKINGYKVNVIDAENWKDYVELPEYIVNKWEKKQIPPALFTDLLRLQLLIKYGGTWIDSTVLCTGNVNENHNDNFLNADLFLFQYTPKGTTKDISISNWFISAHSNNEVLMTLRDVLFAYWKEYNCTLDYYIFHLFFAMVAQECQEEIAAMPYGYSMNSLVLLHHWYGTFDQKKWDKLTKKVCFHKLAFRVDQKTKENENNFYNYILNTNKEIENGRI
ncbi:capsular polysaccharide synthesis protein [Prevotella communis]|uniref:capsular polysaccharide synthesis protein n=1 Tax=Prevotella communis TaxID=2913614 RepID=UPI001EDAF6F2|nr:capsular polysaccharide synthesis protein [Prevotella communis]UKK56829.1 capsular polysaccharide synthesis protein [Prevotella communis]